MVSRISKKTLKVLMVLFLGVFLASCEINQYFEYENHYYNNSSSSPEVNEVYQILNKYYYEKLPLDLSKIDTLDELFLYTDPYTYVYQIATSSIDQGDKYVGLGITITNHSDGLLITDLNIYTNIDDHLFVGDIITKIDGFSLETLDFEGKTILLKGSEGDTKTLRIKRLEQEDDVEVTLLEIPNPSIVGKYIDEGNIGVIKILRFEGDTYQAFNNALHSYEDKGMEKLIIDVRDNGGGYLISATEILENFVYGEDPYFYLYDVKADEYTSYKPLKKATRKPYEIITLINRNSASASEVLAGTLSQYGYQTFGELSYGKDLYQVVSRLNTLGDQYRLSLTLGYWLLKDMTTVRGGIEPDIKFNETGIRMFNQPSIQRTYKKGDSSANLMIFQYLISREVEGTYELGLFNQNFFEMIILYQYEHDLPLSGYLDGPTMINLITTYRNLIKTNEGDILLNEAIEYARSLD